MGLKTADDIFGSNSHKPVAHHSKTFYHTRIIGVIKCARLVKFHKQSLRIDRVNAKSVSDFGKSQIV